MDLSLDTELRCVNLRNLTKDRKEVTFTLHLTLDKIESILYDVNIKFKKVEVDNGIYLLRLIGAVDDNEKYYVFNGDETYILLNAKEFNQEIFSIYRKLAFLDKLQDIAEFDFKAGVDIQEAVKPVDNKVNTVTVKKNLIVHHIKNANNIAPANISTRKKITFAN